MPPTEINRAALEAEKAALDERLTRGWAVIDERIAAAGPAPSRAARVAIVQLEEHWGGLLRRYKAVCDLLTLAGGAPCPS